MGEASVYKNIVRTGWVSSVNAADRTARVTFKDMGTTFVSGPLKVIKNPPFIPAKDVVQETQTESGGSGDASFAAHSHTLKGNYQTNTDAKSEYYYGLAVGDKVVLLRNAGGQAFLVLGRV